MTIDEIDQRIKAGETVRIPARYVWTALRQAEEHLGGDRVWHIEIANGVAALSKPGAAPQQVTSSPR